ncbi:putative oligosaccharyl transferase subunit [Trypanosoma cruzi]|uniref:dolichyl-diphosphooligosaccharide--protein glycotransferase n=1 Tax=Trypanosoma cruzi TaxID=5693 RepID=A0A2V2WVU1_TRYCR|nr:putative oligosaccharyl transferase subunit [Trypanosoma cruzi]
MLGMSMTMNDVCCLIPAWFGSVATVLAALLAYETWGSFSGAAMTAGLFAILPAHLMRSMAGEYDNECIAMAAMLLTFYLWVRSLRNAGSWPIGVLTGLAYGYMVSTWGGFIFVLNMVALHAAVCVFADWMRGRYDASLLWAYSLFFVVGHGDCDACAARGWTPFKSLEQLMALLVFIFMWALHFSEILRRRADVPIRSNKALRIRARVFMITCGVLVLAASAAGTTGILRAPLLPRPCFVCAAHPHRQPSRRFRRGTHAHVSGCILVVFPHMPAGIVARVFVTLFLCSAPVPPREVVHSAVLPGRLLFLDKNEPADAAFRARCGCVDGNMLGGVMDLSVDSLFLPPGVCEDGKKRQMKGRHKQKDLVERAETRISTAWKKMCRRRPFFAAALVGALLVLGGHALLTPAIASTAISLLKPCRPANHNASPVAYGGNCHAGTTITSRTCGCATTHRRTPAFLHGGTTATRSRGSGIARALRTATRESRAHCHNWKAAYVARGEGPLAHSAPCRLCTDMDRQPGGGLDEVAAHGTHWQQCVPRHLPRGRPVVLQLWV